MMASLRPLQSSDLDTVVRHRHRMFVDAGRPDDADLAEKSAAFRDWLRPRLDDGRYYGWLACCDGEVAAGLGMMTVDWPPHPLHIEPARGYILNVYTEPQHRRRGLARRLTDCALAEARRRGLRLLFLHATQEGGLVYRAAGFSASNEMQLAIKN
jgi:ribosomal protein S18 acetylase RimI-like enzyme